MNHRSTIQATYIRLILSLLALGMLAACGKSVPTNTRVITPVIIPMSELSPVPLFTLPTPPPKPAQPSIDIVQWWLQSKVCAPPCWEGITPGQTGVMEAVEILNRHPFVTQIDFGSIPSEADGSLTWSWMGSEYAGGFLKFPQHTDSQIISWMTIVSPDRTYSFTDIIDIYGEPSHVVPSFIDTDTAHFGRTIWYDLQLIYLTHGFYLETERTFSAPPHIASSMPLAARVTFFPSTIAGLDAALKSCTGCGMWTSANLLPWQGFQDFATYCKQARPPAEPMFGEMCGRVP